MGYNNENSAVSWMAFDIETAAREDVSPLLPEPKADGRLTDPAKIANDIAAKRAEQSAKLPLDINGCRLVALGYQTSMMPAPLVLTVDSMPEREMLRNFLRAQASMTLVGFYSRLFDLPVIFQRCRYLGLTVPDWRGLLSPYGRARRHVDLFDELTFDNARQEGVVPRKLVTFCRQFGIDIPEDDAKGEDMAALVKAEDWPAISQHCARDISRTVALAQRIGAIPASVPAVA